MDEHAEINHQAGNLRDLKMARAAASESDRKYRELVQHANSAIIRIDTGFRILFINEYALNFFGYSAEELLGRNLLEILVPEEDEYGSLQHDISRQAVESPEIHGGYDQQNRCRNGQLVWVHWSVRALRDARGNTRELLCVGVDITKRKAAEVRAEWYRKRARRLADRLVASEEMERASIAVYLHDNIIQNLSLANIQMGGVFDALRELDSPAVKQPLLSVRRLIEDAVAECRSIMDQLAPALLSELGLGAAVCHMVEKQEAVKGTTVEVRDHLDEERLPENLAALLFRTIRELFMNALKYAGAGLIQIGIARKGDCVEVRVEDDGCGFDPDVLEDIHYDEEGGFGLFAVRELIESLGGTLRIDSGPGQGTVVTVSVPHQRPQILTQLS